jgi:hypothetical protein
MNFAPLRDAADEISGAIVSFDDISEFERVEGNCAKARTVTGTWSRRHRTESASTAMDNCSADGV